MAPRASIAAGYFLKAQNEIGTTCFATAHPAATALPPS